MSSKNHCEVNAYEGLTPEGERILKCRCTARPEYQLVRYEEDWSRLVAPEDRTDPFDALKNRDLGGGWRLTAGGPRLHQADGRDGRRRGQGRAGTGRRL